jgi:mutator protein MutT
MNIIFRTLFKVIPTDFFARKYPVSVKGIILIGGKIVLLKNEREEWELPGGKLEKGETTEDCVVREIKEELNLDVHIHSIVDVWMYDVLGKVEVLIITYLCDPVASESDLRISHEHKELKLFRLDEIEALDMPEGYKNSIRKALIATPKE